jgi:aminobenzoyl-glutamate transport protein
MDRMLDVIERIGTKVPHPAVIFLVMIVVLIVLSHGLHLLGVLVSCQVVDPATHLVNEAIER